MAWTFERRFSFVYNPRVFRFHVFFCHHGVRLGLDLLRLGADGALHPHGRTGTVLFLRGV